MKRRGRSRKSKSQLKIKNIRRFEILGDFLIKFNLLAIPMYAVMFAGITFYPLQLFLTDVVYSIVKAGGYWIARSDIMIMLFAPVDPPGPPLVETVVMGFDCTAWKTMYALMALVIAAPVAGRQRKVKFILVGIAAIFVLNIIRLVTTITTAYAAGFQYLEIMHTLLWREGLIIALLAIWFVWLKNQKNNISQSQTILRTLYSLTRKEKPKRRKVKKRGPRKMKKRKRKKRKR